MLKVGIVGCGSIGGELCKAIVDRKVEAELVAIWDVDENRIEGLSLQGGFRPEVVPPETMAETVDLVVEAASGVVAPEVARIALEHSKDVMVMSVGGLLDYPELFELANRKGVRIHLPSGALAGLDGIMSSAIGKLSRVSLTTRKPPAALAGAPYIRQKGINLNEIRSETVLFDGTAREAVAGFPKNVNVAAALCLAAGLRPEEVRVRIITDPAYESNSHEIQAEGEFGNLMARTDNVPSPGNPKTSYLAVLSAIATLKQIAAGYK